MRAGSVRDRQTLCEGCIALRKHSTWQKAYPTLIRAPRPKDRQADGEAPIVKRPIAEATRVVVPEDISPCHFVLDDSREHAIGALVGHERSIARLAPVFWSLLLGRREQRSAR